MYEHNLELINCIFENKQYLNDWSLCVSGAFVFIALIEFFAFRLPGIAILVLLSLVYIWIGSDGIDVVLIVFTIVFVFIGIALIGGND